MSNDRYKYLFKCEMYFQSVWDDDIFVLFADREIAHRFSLPLRTEFKSSQEAYRSILKSDTVKLLKPLSEDCAVWKIKRIKERQVLMECTLTKLGVAIDCIISKHFKKYAINGRQRELCILSENYADELLKTEDDSNTTGDILFDGNNYFVYVTPISYGSKHIIIGPNSDFYNKLDCEVEITNDNLLNMHKVRTSSSAIINTASDILKKVPESYILWRIHNLFLKKEVDRKDFDRLAYYINMSKRYCEENMLL